MNKMERQQRHQARLERKANKEREWHERQAPKIDLLRQTEALAIAKLEQPRQLLDHEAPEWAASQLRLWHYPSFAPYKSWSIHYNRRVDKYLLYRVSWDRDKDVDRIDKFTEIELAQADPTPSIQFQSTKIRREEIDKRLAELRRLTFPIFIENQLVGIDGDWFGIEMGDGFVSSRISWWSEGPPEWVEVISWYRGMMDFFEGHVD
jgi:hypothetical protein